MRSAIGNILPAHAAKHPGRASAGTLLLQRLQDQLEYMHANQKRCDAHIAEDDCDNGIGPSVPLPLDDGAGIVRLLFLDSIPEDCIEIESIRPLFQLQLLKPFLRVVTEERASVEATFHGTRVESLRGVWEQGLLPGLCAIGAYGRGSYVAAHAGVAHQYCSPDARGYRYMCVVLAAPGCQATKGRPGEEPVVTAMDRLQNPTQYCFSDPTRLYVSHVITYRVTYTMGRRVGGGWEDPFQRALNTALVRSGMCENKSGIR